MLPACTSPRMEGTKGFQTLQLSLAALSGTGYTHYSDLAFPPAARYQVLLSQAQVYREVLHTPLTECVLMTLPALIQDVWPWTNSLTSLSTIWRLQCELEQL